jgi:hypothetical protein
MLKPRRLVRHQDEHPEFLLKVHARHPPIHAHLKQMRKDLFHFAFSLLSQGDFRR